MQQLQNYYVDLTISMVVVDSYQQNVLNHHIVYQVI